MSEKTSAAVAKLAARAMTYPLSLTPDEIQTLAASCLTQAPDREDPADLADNFTPEE